MSTLFGTGTHTATLRDRVEALTAGGPPYDTNIISSPTGSYNTNNWAASLDWTGINWNSNKAGTLITSDVVLSAAHFGAIPNPLIFTDAAGNQYSRNIVSATNIGGGTDVRLSKLDSPLPSNIAVYALPDPSLVYNDMRGGLAVYTEQTRGAYVGCIRPRIDEFFDLDEDPTTDTSLWKNVGGTFPLVGGDSGHPAFILGSSNRMILTCTWWLANASCVYLGDSALQTSIQNAITNTLLSSTTITTAGIEQLVITETERVCHRNVTPTLPPI